MKTVVLVYSRGRESMLKKIEAEARLKELDVEEKEFKLLASKIDYSLGLIKKLGKDPNSALLKQRVEMELANFLLKDRVSPEVKQAQMNLLGNSETIEQKDEGK